MNYVVEAIVDKKYHPKTSTYYHKIDKPMYCVKWEGYDSSLNTWEPI